MASGEDTYGIRDEAIKQVVQQFSREDSQWQESMIQDLLSIYLRDKDEVKLLTDKQSEQEITIGYLKQETERRDIAIRQLEEQNERLKEELNSLQNEQSHKGCFM